jgi:hypothetical protein
MVICPECNAKIDLKYIRQSMRNKNISKSELGQWIHDKMPNDFYWLDIDGIVYKKATKILRIIEEKKPGQELKPSQLLVLKNLAIAIDYLVEQNIVSIGSGVFVLWTTQVWGTISQMTSSGDCTEKLILSKNQFENFVSGQELVQT